MTTTFDRLSTILARDFKLSAEQLSLDAPLDSLGIDSLGTVELLWNVEDAFGIKLPSEPADLKTLGDVVRHVDVLVAAQLALQSVLPSAPPTDEPLATSLARTP